MGSWNNPRSLFPDQKAYYPRSITPEHRHSCFRLRCPGSNGPLVSVLDLNNAVRFRRDTVRKGGKPHKTAFPFGRRLRSTPHSARSNSVDIFSLNDVKDVQLDDKTLQSQCFTIPLALPGVSSGLQRHAPASRHGGSRRT